MVNVKVSATVVHLATDMTAGIRKQSLDLVNRQIEPARVAMFSTDSLAKAFTIAPRYGTDVALLRGALLYGAQGLTALEHSVMGLAVDSR